MVKLFNGQNKRKHTYIQYNTNFHSDTIYGIDGRKVAGLSQYLQAGNHSFLLSLPQGIYAIKVKGVGFNYTAKAISQNNSSPIAQISYTGAAKTVASSSQQRSKSSGVTTFAYSSNDLLLYKATSGNYSTIVTDVPTGDKTTGFEFVACTDADGNNYTVVTIGTQTWMAENLKTTKYRDGTSIPNETVTATWFSLVNSGAWCNYNNDAANDTKYGKLYNWYAANNSSNIAPTGWHLCTSAECVTLTSYVGTHYGTSLTTAKALAASTDWTTYNISGAIGNNLNINNYSGFSAIPSGTRNSGTNDFSVNGNVFIFWTSSLYSGSDYYGHFLYNSSHTMVGGGYPRQSGFAVRCIKD